MTTEVDRNDIAFLRSHLDSALDSFKQAAEERDALRAEVVRLKAQRQVDNEHFIEQIGQQGAEIAQMQRHHDLFCRCNSIRYGKA